MRLGKDLFVAVGCLGMAVGLFALSGSDSVRDQSQEDEIAQRKGEELKAQLRVMNEREARRAAILHPLIDGEMPLRDAVTRYQRIYARDENFLPRLRSRLHLSSDEALVAHELLEWVDSWLSDEPERLAKVRMRLVKELQDDFD
jgi:hypothetical protein